MTTVRGRGHNRLNYWHFLENVITLSGIAGNAVSQKILLGLNFDMRNEA